MVNWTVARSEKMIGKKWTISDFEKVRKVDNCVESDRERDERR
jgi:hypothetical protein